jgi:hypothetical protein
MSRFKGLLFLVAIAISGTMHADFTHAKEWTSQKCTSLKKAAISFAKDQRVQVITVVWGLYGALLYGIIKKVLPEQKKDNSWHTFLKGLIFNHRGKPGLGSLIAIFAEASARLLVIEGALALSVPLSGLTLLYLELYEYYTQGKKIKELQGTDK